MAYETVSLTPGVGADIAVDTVSGQQIQVVKLDVGADGATAPLSNSNPVPVSDAGGSLTVDGSVSLAAAIPAGTNNIGDVDVASIAAGDNNIGNVDIVTMPNVTLAAGTNTNEVVGDVAQDAPVAGNPVLVGLRASAAIPTNMSTDGDAVYPYADRAGRTVTTQKCGTPTASNVSGSASSVTLLAANTSRLGATIYNDSSAALYAKLGATASTTSFTVKMNQDDYFEVPCGYTGIIDGIWASATGAARIVELT